MIRKRGMKEWRQQRKVKRRNKGQEEMIRISDERHGKDQRRIKTVKGERKEGRQDTRKRQQTRKDRATQRKRGRKSRQEGTRGAEKREKAREERSESKHSN